MCEDKIDVVIVVIGVIFLGIALYLFYLDRKITQIKNKKENKNLE